MNFNYRDWLSIELINIQHDLELDSFKIVVEEEMMFLPSKMEKDSIYVVIKKLADSELLGVINIPYQILIYSEQNNISNTQAIFDALKSRNTNTIIQQPTERITQTYSSATVITAFDQSRFGYRTIFAMASNLIVMSGVMDIDSVVIDGVEAKPINFNISYAMQTNTQAKASENISSSTKMVSTLGISLTIPFKNDALSTKVLNIIDETNTGNESFECVITFTNARTITKNFKLTAVTLSKDINKVPSFQLGWSK